MERKLYRNSLRWRDMAYTISLDSAPYKAG